MSHTHKSTSGLVETVGTLDKPFVALEINKQTSSSFIDVSLMVI